MTTVLEIGRDARAALAAAAQTTVLMTFARGEVLETDRGEIVWFDCDPEAFSPRGVLIAGAIPTRSAAPRSPLDDSFALHCQRFLRALDTHPLADAAPLLLGLGAGLTPAGDDYLGGFLCLLHHRGRPSAIDTANTHAISRARLAMHMRGEGTRAELRFLRALLDERDPAEAEGTLRRHGHSSGEEFMNGARAAHRRCGGRP